MTFQRYFRGGIVRASLGIAFLLTLSTPTQLLFAEDAKELLQKFVDRWQAIKEFDVEIVADIQYSTLNCITKAESAGSSRRDIIRFAKTEGKSYLSVDTTSSTDGNTSYQLLEHGNKQWFTEKGQTKFGSDKMDYGGVPVSFRKSLQVQPFSPWWLTIAGERALHGFASDTNIADEFLGDKIFESSSMDGGTHVMVGAAAKEFTYEIVFDKDYDGLPSTISLFPNHKQINLKDPSSNTRYFYRSKLSWRKSKKDWLVSRVVVDALNGPPMETEKIQFDSEWNWSEKVDESLFEPPTTITK